MNDHPRTQDHQETTQRATLAVAITRKPRGRLTAFTEGLERVRVRSAGAVAPTADRVVHFVEHQVAASLYTYSRLGYSVGELLRSGRLRLKSRHRSLLAGCERMAFCNTG